MRPARITILGIRKSTITDETGKFFDPTKFARGVLIGLQDEEEDGSTPVTRIFDAVFIRAAEDDMGVDEDGLYGIDLSSSPWIGETEHKEELSQSCIDGYKDSTESEELVLVI